MATARSADQGRRWMRARLEFRRLRSRAGDLARGMAELQYGRIPGTREAAGIGARRRKRGRAGPAVLVRNRVTDEEVAEVVSKWTGIPVSRMLEGEKRKACCKHGRRDLHRAPGRPGPRRWTTVAQCDPSGSRAGLADPNRPNGSVPVPRPDRRRQDRTVPRPWPSSLFDSEDALMRVSTCPSSWKSTRSPG